MALFDKRKSLDRLKQIEHNIPSGTLPLIYNMEGQEAAIDAQVGTTATPNKDLYWEDWVRVNLWADYMANRFKYEAKEFKHNLVINRALRAGYIYGTCGVWDNNGTPEIVRVRRENPTTYEVMVVREDGQEYDLNDQSIQSHFVPKDSVIIYRFNSLGWSAFVVMRPVFKLERQIQKALYNEAVVLPTRTIHDTDAGNKSTKVSQQFIDFNSPIIHRIDGGSDRFSGLTLESNSQQLLELIEYAKNYYYETLGRRTNSDFKRSHSLNAELEANSYNVEAIERDRYMFLKDFLRNYSDMFGTEIILENVNGEMSNVFDDIDTQQEEPEVRQGVTSNETKPTNN